jgi:hypothetical protein
MARFSGKLGFAHTQKIRPGVTEDVIVERKAFGDVLRNTRKLDDSGKVISDITIGNSFSVVADAYISTNIFALKYVEWKGVRWTVSDVEVQERRLILRPGGVYNGPTPAASSTP